MPETVNYGQLLTKLKNKLDKGEMSTLVGAGFSKNIDSSFPDWFELIHEMTLFTEGRRIKQQISSRYPKLDEKSDDFKKLLEDEIWNHNVAIGPLKAVSRYIQTKGFREAVDHMVELHTPLIEVIAGQRFLCRMVEGKLEKKLLTAHDVASHEKLVNLPWTNIFTTNYDNLLEKCIDLDKKAEIENRIVELNANISQRKETVKPLIKQHAEKTAELDEKLAELKKIQADSVKDRLKAEVSSVDDKALIDEIMKLNGEVSKLAGNISFEKIFISRNEAQIKDLNDIVKVFRTTVLSSSELAIKKDQNIIKIHGSICCDETKTFGFDGDVSKNYVIAQEDYDTYPQKHEAFMQLMRISLLRESFCLFGFSGIDPNFLGWIAWVRDVIQKNPTRSGESDKIFMIDVGEKAAESDKVLFYKNHQIAFIPLGHPECLSFLEQATGKKVADNTYKARINLLLDFLSTDKIPSDYKTAYEVLKQNDYQNLWDTRPFSVHAAEKLKRLVKAADEIILLKHYNRIPLLFGDTDHEQQDALEQFVGVYQELEDDPVQVKDLLKVSLVMLQEVYLPHSVIFLNQQTTFSFILKIARETGLFVDHFLLIDLRDAVWRNDREKVDELARQLQKSEEDEVLQELSHQQALHAFYNFEFKILHEVLDSWQANGHWLMKKAGLQSRLSLPSAISTLENGRLQSAQENAYKYHILSYLQAASDLRGNGEEHYKVVRAIEKGNIKSFEHTVKRLIKNLKKKPEKLLPYGEGKMTITNTIVFSKTSEKRISLQLLFLWLESGHPLHLTYVNYLSVQDVYKPISQAMLWYPEAALFFALQYSDSKFITRISQDLIYNESLNEYVLPIGQNMMRGFFDAYIPPAYKKSLLIVLSTFIDVIEPNQWQDFFVSVWDFELQRGLLTSDHRIHKHEFLIKGISLITDVTIAEKIVHQLLEAFIGAQEQQVKENVVQMLYQFRNNTYLNEQIKDKGLNLKPAVFEELITRLKDDIFFLFVLGNISFSFSVEQKESVKRALKEMDVYHNKNSRLWRVILHFGDGDPEIERKVKTEILRSEELWRSGIDLTDTKVTYTGNLNFLSLSPLRRYKKGRSLKWTTSEIHTLYSRLVTELDTIHYYITNYEHTGDFREIIKEMKLFLEAEEDSLQDIEGFWVVHSKVMELFNLERTSEQNIEALFGEDKSAIIIEIENISEDIYRKDRLAESEDLIAALIYRLLMKKEPGLPAALQAISNWFFYLPGKDLLKKFQGQLELILHAYKSGREMELDEPSFHECLIKLAIVLKRWNADERLTGPILDLLNSSRFNSIKHNLKTEFLADGVI